MEVSRFEIHLVNLDPTVGVEIKKTRPCLIISPNEMNRYVRTAIVAPLTTRGRDYPTRVACKFQGREGQIVLDQIRAVDRLRLTKKLGRIDASTARKVLEVLQEMFA